MPTPLEPTDIPDLQEGVYPVPFLNTRIWPILRALLPTSAQKESLDNDNGNGNGTGAVVTTLSVAANQEAWTDTGIVLNGSDALTIEAFGNVSEHPGTVPYPIQNNGFLKFHAVVVPSGTTPVGDYPKQAAYNISSALSRKIGCVWVRVRDVAGYYSDNIGTVTATLSYYADAATAVAPATVAVDMVEQSELDAAIATRAPTAHTHTSSQISDLTESVQDAVGAFLHAGAGINVVYNDALNTFTITNSAPLSTESVQDIVGAMAVSGTNATAAYDDAAGTLTISATGGASTSTEDIQDIVAALLAAGTNVGLSYNDAAGTLTVSVSGGTSGTNGWTPTLAIEGDGARSVLRVTGWTGGTGAVPASGSYLGATGYVAAIADATDVRGAQGIQGPQGAPGTGGTGGDSFAAIRAGSEVFIHEHFATSVVGYVSGTGASVTTNAVVNNRLACYCITGTTATGHAWFPLVGRTGINQTVARFAGMNSMTEMESGGFIRFYPLVAGEDWRAAMGFIGAVGRTTTNSMPTEGVFFRTNATSGMLECVCAAGGTETVVSAGAVSTSDWVQWRIRHTPATGAQFYINGMLVATISTNIPTANTVRLGVEAGIQKFSGTTTVRDELASMWFWGKYS